MQEDYYKGSQIILLTIYLGVHAIIFVFDICNQVFFFFYFDYYYNYFFYNSIEANFQ